VIVPELGGPPSDMVYHGHGESLKVRVTPDTLDKSRPFAIVVTDMHGSYPPNWEPQGIGKMQGEYLLAKQLTITSPVKKIDFSGHCREFSAAMQATPFSSEYKYPWPWQRGFKY